MTNDLESRDSAGGARRALPWALAAAGLGLYLLTLNPWASLFNVAHVARIAGWTWLPDYVAPVSCLVALPLKLLPAAALPVALNVLSAVFASLVLWQLARCVLLLPHDRTPDQREREAGEGALFSGRFWWLPPIFAVTLCGLQLTFWEHATNGTMEMLDLLLFSFVVRAILEYHHTGHEPWLARAAVVMGAGMSNNTAMVAFFPVFVGALVWVRGISFFNARFLMRAFLCGVAGLSFYLLLPLISAVHSPEIAGFWPALKANLGSQFDTVKAFSVEGPFRSRLAFLACLALVPIVVIAIRWASYFGDSSQTGQWFATTAIHLVHLAFLGVACWVSLDPPFSPRNSGYGMTYLPFYFLGALGTGYFTGYFLLIFGPRIERRIRRPPTPFLDKLHVVSTVGVVALTILMPVSLVMRNLPDLRLTNGPMVRNYAQQLVENLPAKAVLISDEPARQFFTEALLAAEHRSADYMVINSDWLHWDFYHKYLHKRYGTNWTTPPNLQTKAHYESGELLALVGWLSLSNRICYLHPSFGYYFEQFYPIPAGLVYELTPFAARQLLPPPLATNTLASNEAFFSQVAGESLGPILAVTDRKGMPEKYFGGDILRKIRLREHRNPTALILGTHYSRALNCWGVEAQKAGWVTNATRWFELALRLNAGNVVAEKNLAFNEVLRAGKAPVIQPPSSVEDLFGSGRSWDQVLSANGPYDDPSLVLLQSYQFVSSGLYHQAAQGFARVRQCAEDDLASRIWLAQLQLMASNPDAALAVTAEVHEHPARFSFNLTNRIELLSVEATAHYAKRNSNQAQALIERLIEEYPKSPPVLNTAIILYNQNLQYSNSLKVAERLLTLEPNDTDVLLTGISAYEQNLQYSNALKVVEHLLVLTPDDPRGLLHQGFLLMQFKAWEESLRPLNRLLQLQTNHPYALFNRASVYLSTDRFSEAQADCEAILGNTNNLGWFQPNYLLTEIALRRQDPNAAMRYAENYLQVIPTNSPEHAFMAERLRLIKGGTPQ